MKVYGYARKAPDGITEAEAYLRTVNAVLTMDRLPGPQRMRVQSNWPSEFAYHAEAIKWAVFAGEASKSKAYKRLRAADFADIHLDFDEDDEGRPERAPLTRAAIADAEVAGAWFASLALLPWNAEEFNHAVAAFRRGARASPWVDDQRIIAMHARGASLKTIGTLLHGGRLNADQVAARIGEIARALADIANGRSCSNDRGKGAPSRKPPRASSGAR